jgi:nucleoside phosphorylase
MPQPPRSFDIAIVTVLDEAREAVTRLLELRNLETTAGYWWGIVGEKTVACGQCPPLNLPAEGWTSKMLPVWLPRCLLVVDIGGGVDGREELHLGDVVAHNYLHAYEPEKFSPEGDSPRYINLLPPAQSLMAAADVIRKRPSPSWQERIATERPVPGIPKIVLGELLSGDKLLSNPGHELVAKLLDIYKKAIAADMESAGIAYAAWEMELEHPIRFLVLRGISDYFNAEDAESNQATRDRWRRYAAEAAAAVCTDLVEAYAISPGRASWESEYLQKLGETLEERLEDIEQDFETRVALDGYDGDCSVEELSDFLTSSRKVVLTASAGAGKSVVLKRLANRLLLEGEFFPVLVDLKKWKPEWDEVFLTSLVGAAVYDAIDTVLRAALGGMAANLLRQVAEERPVVLLVDGLNEVRGDGMADSITTSIDEWLRQTPTARAVVTDRTIHERYTPDTWAHARVQRLAETEVRSQIDRRFGAGAYDGLTKQDRERLSLPFFLCLSIGPNSSGPELGTREHAMSSFFRNQLQLGEEALGALAEAAFGQYQNRSRTFEFDEFQRAVGTTTSDLLRDAGVIVEREGAFLFDHQLYHDYLAARHFAANPYLWVPDRLDDVTFKAASFDPLPLTSAMVEETAAKDLFLRAVYDWNWNAAISVMAAIDEDGLTPCSRPLELALLSLAAQKRFDPVTGTAERASATLERFSAAGVKNFREAPTLDALIDLVLELEPGDSEWFTRWRSIFTRRPPASLAEDEIALAWSDDSVLGWTLANTLRRFQEHAEWSTALRSGYSAASGSTPRESASRWRVVHAIGRWRTEENVTLLLKAVDEDPYMWVKYGAMRSLVEIAALANDDLRERVLREIGSRIALMTIPSEPLSQVVWSAMRDDAVRPWGSVVRPLVLGVLNEQQLSTEHTRWQKRLAEFDQYWNER